MLDPAKFRISVPEIILKNWTPAMQELIRKDYLNREYGICEEHCDRLLLYVPDDPVAAEYLKKAQDSRDIEDWKWKGILF